MKIKDIKSLADAKKYLKDTDVDEDLLDEEVIDLKCSEASEINNQGTDEQLEYIHSCIGLEELKDFLRDLGIEETDEEE